MTDTQKHGRKPSRMTDGKYAILMETNGEHCESWYYFIRHDGNEEALQHLQEQLQQVDWYVLDDLSTFDLELDHLVSAQTAKEMSNVDLNPESFHRKFDGKLEQINFDFSKKDRKDNDRMIAKIYEMLGCGQIEDYIDDEDLDSEYLGSSGSDTEDGASTDSEEAEPAPEKPVGKKGLPPAVSAPPKKIEIPRWAKAKQRHRQK
jgi:hypothetical protein